ncbi:Ferric iron ABC transporter [Klebsiella pneumoniae]|nr:Ferric iron ABC transporter [Klebsiella pneumoniae]
MNVLRRKWQGLPRGVVVCITALVIYVPLLFIVVQSFLSAPFFSRSKSWSLEAFAFIFTDPDFYLALRSGFILAFGLVIIAIPLGGILAFLMVRTDLPGRRIIEPLILVPIFVSPMVLGFGYVVAAGPVGFFSQWAQQLIGFVPWNIYSMFSIVVIAGLTHVPHAYLYISSALRSVGSDVEEAARTVGATPLQVMTSVSLPMVRPSILYACVLLFFLGLEVFGLMLVLGDPEGNMVLATYLYKLTNKLGTPSYHLMAAVAVVLICITIPLVMLQRRLMRTANRFVTMKGKASQARALPLGKWRWVAGAVVMMERVSSGENLIGYNILGSYAEARAKNDPSLGIAYPKDYVLVLSRVSFISQESEHPNAAKLWLDYVLSEKGQQILASQADIPSIRRDIAGKNDIDGMTALLGKALKPIPVNETLLDYLQPQKRLQFIKQWRSAAAK